MVYVFSTIHGYIILRAHSDVDQLTHGLTAKLIEHHTEVMVRIPFRNKNFTTAFILCVSAMINYVQVCLTLSQQFKYMIFHLFTCTVVIKPVKEKTTRSISRGPVG